MLSGFSNLGSGSVRGMKRTGTCAVMFAALGLLAACGGGDDDSGGVAALEPAADTADTTDSPDPSQTDSDAEPAEEMDPEEAVLAYAECMREQGIDMPDPEITEDGGVTLSREAGGDGEPDVAPALDMEAMEAANDECGHLMESAGVTRGPSDEELAEMEDEMLEFAQCMRDEGVDMPDPDFSADEQDAQVSATETPGDGPVIGGPFGTLDLGDPDVEAAFEVCREILGAAAPPRLDGPESADDQ